MAVRTRTQLKNDADTLLPDNTSGQISPEDVRERVKDLADSAVFAEDGPFSMDNMEEGADAKIMTAAERGKIAALGTAATANTGTASGNVPVLQSGGKLAESVLPSVAITDTFEVASQAAMLALTAERGDVAVRSDLNKSFILKTEPASTLANWVELRTPTDAVLSVAGKTGAVSLVKGDVGLGNVDNTSDANKPVSTAQQTALDGKANLAGGNTFSGAQKFTSVSNEFSAGGQAIILKSGNTGGNGPSYIRYQDVEGTNIGYIGLGGSNSNLAIARNSVGILDINALTGGTIRFTGSARFLSGDLYVGTGTPAVAVQFDYKVALGDSVNANRVSTQTPGGSGRALSLVDTSAVLRMWRRSTANTGPGLELFAGDGSDDATDPVIRRWDIGTLYATDQMFFRKLRSAGEGGDVYALMAEANGNVGIGTQFPNTVDASAQLEVASTDRGFLPPRMTTAQRNAISSPANGLIVYDTTVGALFIYAGSWVQTNAPTVTVLGSGVDLDTLILPGVYAQNTNAGASGGMNYPAPVAGVLEVLYAGISNIDVIQRYTTYRSNGTIVYWRSRSTSGPVWGPWYQAATKGANGIALSELDSSVSGACVIGRASTSGNFTQLTLASAATGGSVPLRGSGGVLSVGTPTDNTHATTKLYVDDALATKETLGEQAGINTVAGASYTLVLADKGKVVERNVASANTLTVPPNSSVAFPVNTRIDVVQYGAGQTTIAAGSGVTIRSADGKLKLNKQYSGATLYKRATNEWVLIGDLVA